MTTNLSKANRNTLLALLALGLFVVFDIVGVSLNYLLSWRVEQQAIGINLAGRQRMLSQRMVKVLLQIDNARRNGEPAKAYYDELKLTFDLFDNTLKGFDAGHETKGGAGEKLFLPAVTEPKARQAVSEAVALWQDYRSKVLALIDRGEQGDESILKAALNDAQARNLRRRRDGGQDPSSSHCRSRAERQARPAQASAGRKRFRGGRPALRSARQARQRPAGKKAQTRSNGHRRL